MNNISHFTIRTSDRRTFRRCLRKWDFNLNSQAEDRLCRLGQTNFVNCRYLLHKGTVDENVKERLNDKNNASNWIVGTEQQYQMMLKAVRAKVLK